MDHTFNDTQLKSYMFDSSSSMALSTQYFTALQLLRVARQQIEESQADWTEFCENVEGKSGQIPVIDLLTRDDYNHEAIDCWNGYRNALTRLYQKLTQELHDRIDRKTKEVESLRDGVQTNFSVELLAIRYSCFHPY